MALALVQRAEQELLAPPVEGKTAPRVKDLQEAVEFAMNLLVKLPKLKPEDDKDDAGIDALREALADPGAVVARLIANHQFIAALKARGWLPPPPKLTGRPSKQHQAERVEYEARAAEVTAPDEDDSVLRKMLNGGVQ